MLRLHRALTEGLGCVGDRFHCRLHPDIELSLHIDPHAIARDERLFSVPTHFQPQGVHIDRNDFVKNGKDERAAIHNDLLAAEASSDEGNFFR